MSMLRIEAKKFLDKNGWPKSKKETVQKMADFSKMLWDLKTSQNEK